MLILVVGPSGAGKDTLLDGARVALTGRNDILFARRAITRPRDAGGEAHEALTEAEFAAAKAGGAFALDWAAHGFRYGVRRTIEADLGRGRRVVASVSRQVLGVARVRYGAIRIVLVTAPPTVLALRLAARGREGEAAIRERLARAEAIAVEGGDLVRIDNSGPVADGVAAMIRALTAVRP